MKKYFFFLHTIFTQQSIGLLLSFFFFLFPWNFASAQFYNGSYQEFGKNRVQYDDFFWSYYKFSNYSIYFYIGGKNTAIYTARTAQKTLDELENKFDFYLDEEEKISFIIYNKLEHFHQNNIGLDEANNNNIGGITRISGTKVFLYFDGSHTNLDRQIRAGLSEIIIHQMMYGETWKDMVKNSALLSLPDWYVNGLLSYFSRPWDVELDNKVKDAVLNGQYDKFNRMNGEEAKFAGHAMWNYIAETYGTNVIPNILYMTRISRNIESGFLFVLGSSLKTITEESVEYYKRKYQPEDDSRISPSGESLPVKIKKTRTYSQFKISPDKQYAAFATNESGQKKVWLYDFQEKKLKRIMKQGYKLQRINDDVYPLLAWHPSGKVLSIIAEKKGQIELIFYTPESKKFQSRPIFKLEKVLDFSYSEDGKNFVLSAMANGQSDIFIYKIAPNIQESLTNDSPDDFHPAFINSNDVVFSSNRTNDTLKQSNSEEAQTFQNNLDLFLYNSASLARTKVLKRVANSSANENFPSAFNKKNFTFLSDENGISNRYTAYFDSIISSIDTAFHYRYITRSFPLTNYSRNILENNISLNANKISEVVFQNGKYNLYLQEIPENTTSSIEMENTNFKEKLIKEEEIQLENERQMREKTAKDNAQKTSMNEKISYTTVAIPEETPDTVNPAYIDINNYKFSDEKKQTETIKSKEENKEQKIIISAETDTTASSEIDFTLPNQQTYNVHFNATEIITQFDFNFANQIYQRFNGGPYINPGLGTVVKIGLLDLFEDYRIEGGMRYAYNSNANEYFISLEDRSSNIDKKYILQRQALTSANNFYVQKTFIHQGKYVLKFPISEVAAVRGTVNLRNDKAVALSTDRPSLEAPNKITNWAGLKLEYVFDNSIAKALNLFYGTRAKIFAEHYREIATDKQLFKDSSDITIVGFDVRHYFKIHRELIWANRVTASTSFGSRKLLYYLGSVDNWMLLSDKPRFDYSTPISSTENYYFQTLATPMRGFLQNARNGNTFAVINSELRCPVFKYLMNKPIKSDFISNFQTIIFSDIGTAWTGKTPYSENNTFNETVITENLPPGSYIILKNHRNPIIGGFGYGLRSRLWGYFIRFDRAWGVEDGIAQKPINYFSIGLDF